MLRLWGGLLAGAALLILASPAMPEETVPDDDIFGFTSPTGIGEAGERSIAIENNARIGKGPGTFGSLTTKLQVSEALTDRVWGSFSLYHTSHHIYRMPEIGPDKDRNAFDGASTEWNFILLKRGTGQPVQVNFGVEPGFNRLDPMSGRNDLSFGITTRIAIDWAFDETTFAAVNVGFGTGWERSPLSWAPSSQISASAALTKEVAHGVFLGVEGRYADAFAHPLATRRTGRAFFAGPTFAWQINDHVTLNAVVTPQLKGVRKGLPYQSFNVQDFERTVARLKLSVSF